MIVMLEECVEFNEFVTEQKYVPEWDSLRLCSVREFDRRPISSVVLESVFRKVHLKSLLFGKGFPSATQSRRSVGVDTG